MVVYQDMFDSQKVIKAKNKLTVSEHVYTSRILSGMTFKSPQERENFLRKISEETECNCHHYTGDGGICYYRNCRHDMKDHP